MSTPTPRIGCVSLGCAKALVDSGRILTELRSEGYEVVGNYARADLVVVNTCGFIDGAVARSSADAPEIDGQVYIDESDGLAAGDLVEVVVERSAEHDLRARPC